jgi:hypothetical protein
MKNYRQQITEIMLNKMEDCGEEIFAKIDEVRNIANSGYFDGLKIIGLCNQIETACSEYAMLKELLGLKKPKRVTGLTMADLELAKNAPTGHL